jgi:hypothetical protein
VTPAEAVAAIDLLTGDDPESSHGALDDILFEFAPPEVQAAATRLFRRCRWWATA